jgi:N-acetylneuraminic acid mutarotase
VSWDIVTPKRFVVLVACWAVAAAWTRIPEWALVQFQSASNASIGMWSRNVAIPTARFEAGVTAINGKIYVLGGEAFGKPASGLNQEYDPATNRWRDLAPIPHETSHVGVVAFNGKIYAMGGNTAVPELGPLDLVFEYNVAKDTWRKLPSLSSPRGSMGVVVLDEKIHVVGGRGPDRVTVSTHQVYDPETGMWSMAAPLPVARDHLGAVVLGGRIHIIGGRTAGSTDNTNFHDVYDPATDSWESAAALPTARSGGAAVLYQGLILYVGGECKRRSGDGSGAAYSENEAYDPKTNKWRTLAPLPVGRHGFGAAATSQHAYFAGGSLGCGGGPRSDELLIFSLP